MWPRHNRSDVDRIVFGRDMDCSEEAEGAPPRPVADVPALPVAARGASHGHNEPVAAAIGFLDKLPVPSATDLYALTRLCGDVPAVAQYLSGLYQCDRTMLEPIVRSWYKVANVPPVVPPSRQRSAPPVLAPAAQVQDASVTAVPMVPPASAPLVRAASSAELIASLRRVDARLNRQPSNAHKLNQSLSVASLPEDRAVFYGQPEPRLATGRALDLSYSALSSALPAELKRRELERPGAAHDDALADFLQRTALVHGKIVAVPTGGGARGDIPSNWMTRR